MQVAIKLEPVRTSHPQLLYEAKVIRHLRGGVVSFSLDEHHFSLVTGHGISYSHLRGGVVIFSLVTTVRFSY
jgi:hypothetical protein